MLPTPARALAVVLLSLPTLASPASAREFVWAPEPGLPVRAGASLVAAAPGRVAFAEGGAVWLSERGAAARRVVVVGEVRALAFEPGGALLVGTPSGVVRWEDGREQRLAVGVGAAGEITRMAVQGEVLWVGTAAGLFRGTSDGRFERVSMRGVDGPVSAVVVAAATRLEPETVHAIVGGRWVRRPAVADGPVSGSVVSGQVGRGLPLDLVASDGAVFCVTERAVLRLDDSGLRELPLRLLPGAVPARLAATPGWLWIATDRGLLHAVPGDARPVSRVAPPLGSLAAADLTAQGDEILVAGARGVWRGKANGVEATTASRRAFAPPVAEVQAAVVAYIGLGRGRMGGMARRARLRGFFPELQLRGAYGGGRGHDEDYDEVFTSGELRKLRDHSRDRERDFDAALVLSFDFPDAAMDPEEVDVARETRAWITLRDQVLDEVHQLYFERCRALAAAEAAAPAERLGHRLRAAELAAGLDAWSGGWWQRRADQFTPDGPVSESQGCDPPSIASPRS